VRNLIAIAALALSAFSAHEVHAAATPPDAAADAAVAEPYAELTILLAWKQPGPGVIDETLRDLPLKQPPFDSFNSWKLLGKHRVNLKRDTIKEQQIVPGRVIRLNWYDTLADGRFKVKAEIPDAKQTHRIEFTAGRDKSVWVAGPKHKHQPTNQEGTLWVGVTLRQ
jgi:hypothetical protein